MSACVNEVRDNSLSNMVALFDTKANKHMQSQAVNPFSNNNVRSLDKPRFSKDEYGRPPKGSKTELRGIKASQHIYKELLELCEIIHANGERLFAPHEKPGDPRVVISFGDLFDIYTFISDKLVGMLLRARKHKIVDFEGEMLFQRRDDHVPIILLKPIEEIRKELTAKIEEAVSAIRASEEQVCQESEEQICQESEEQQ